VDRQQVAEEVRSPLAQDQPEPLPGEELHDALGRHAVAIPDGLHPDVRTEVAGAEPAGAVGCRGDDHGDVRRREGRVPRLDVAAAGHDDGGRLGCEAELAPPSLISLRVRLVDPARRPFVRGCVAHRAGTHDHGIGQAAQEAHHEPVRFEESTDLPTAAASHAERHDAVEALDEIGQDRGPPRMQGDRQGRTVAIGKGCWKLAASRRAGRRGFRGAHPQRLEAHAPARRSIGGHRLPRLSPARS
jgi:hypothetical protein